MALLFSDHLTLLAVEPPGVALGSRHRARQPAAPDARPRGGDRGRRARTLFALFDLDGFKAYNDSFGHPAGDALLCRLGENLAAAVQPNGSAYRLGGDEFCVLAPLDGPSGDSVVAIGSAALSEAGKAFSISSSSGSVLLPEEADDASTRAAACRPPHVRRRSGLAPTRPSARPATCCCGSCASASRT